MNFIEAFMSMAPLLTAILVLLFLCTIIMNIVIYYSEKNDHIPIAVHKGLNNRGVLELEADMEDGTMPLWNYIIIDKEGNERVVLRLNETRGSSDIVSISKTFVLNFGEKSKQDLDENSRKEYKTTDLKDKKIVYTFDTKEDYIDLMRYLEDNGVEWVSGQKPTEFSPLSLKPYYNKHNDIEIELESNTLLWNYKSKSGQHPGRKDFEYVHWKRSEAERSEQGLAEFLGWEENIIYEKDEWIYKIEDGILKSKIKNEEMDWVHDNMSINKYIELRNLKRHNPCYMIRTIFEDDNGIQYLTKNGSKVFLAPKSENKDLQTFTEADAKDLIKKYNLQDIAAIVKMS